MDDAVNYYIVLGYVLERHRREQYRYTGKETKFSFDSADWECYDSKQDAGKVAQELADVTGLPRRHFSILREQEVLRAQDSIQAVLEDAAPVFQLLVAAVSALDRSRTRFRDAQSLDADRDTPEDKREVAQYLINTLADMETEFNLIQAQMRKTTALSARLKELFPAEDAKLDSVEHRMLQCMT